MRNWKISIVLLVSLLLAVAAGCQNKTQEKGEVILATTTSTQDSGLLDVLKPVFEEKTGYILKPIAVGTGQALEMGKKGEADALLVHAPSSEKELVDSGVGIEYNLVMHNDFLIVGPPSDPAKIKGKGKATRAFEEIASSESIFVSRGDDSGTDKMEKKLWAKTGIEPAGKWYQEAGAGMGQTLGIASEKGGYTLTDRATFLSQKGKLQLEPMVEGDGALLNIYHVMQVNSKKFPSLNINTEGGKAFVDFMVSTETQEIIAEFGKDKYGEALFFADAGKQDSDLGL